MIFVKVNVHSYEQSPGGVGTKFFIDMILAIFDELIEKKCITSAQRNIVLTNCNLI